MAVYLKRNCWYIDYYFRGRRLREKIGPSRKLALTVLRKRKVEIAENKFLDVKERESVSFELLSSDFINKYSKINKRSWWRDVSSINNLSKVFSGKRLDEITPQLAEQYKADRIKVVKPATVNKELVCLKNMFNRAVDWKLIGANPILKVKQFKTNNKRVRYLEKDEIKQLLDNCPPKLRNIVVLALNTGMRKGELRNLKWRDIDFKNGYINIDQQKNGEKSYQPLNEHAKLALMRVQRHPTSPYVFCKDDGTTYNFRVGFNSAVKRAGIVDFRPHDMRHTFASYLAMAGIDLNTIRELMRHKDYKMTLRYSHLSKDHTTKAVNILAVQLSEQTPIQTPEQFTDLQSQKTLLVSTSCRTGYKD